jgi:hypothetical protein
MADETPTTSAAVEFGQNANRTATAISSASVSVTTRLIAYAPSQKSCDSPRSSASPHVGQCSFSLNQVRRTPAPPHRGQSNRNARPNITAVGVFSEKGFVAIPSSLQVVPSTHQLSIWRLDGSATNHRDNRMLSSRIRQSVNPFAFVAKTCTSRTESDPLTRKSIVARRPMPYSPV